MLVVKRSAGVAQDVNQRNQLQAGNKAHKEGDPPGFKIQGRHHQKFKKGYQWPHKKDSCLPKIFAAAAPPPPPSFRQLVDKTTF